MKIIALYIIYVILTLIFVSKVEMDGWELLLLFATVLVAFIYGKTLGESDKKETK